MTRSAPFLALLLLVVLGLLGPAPALAVEGQTEELTGSKPKSLGDYLADLGGDDAPERLYAARYLRGSLRSNLRTQARAEPGSLSDLDARSVLTELDARIPHACDSALRFPNSAMLCAEMLADLERADRLDEVLAARDVVTEKCAVKRMDKAIARLQALPQPVSP